MRTALALAGAALIAAAPATAQPIVVADSGDSAWVMAAALIGLFAVLPGLILVHGRGRAGETGLAVGASTALATLVFTVIGYSLAFAPGSSLLGGGANLVLGNLDDLLDGATVPESVFVLFQLILVLFATAILVAGVAEQARFGWLMPFAALWLLLVLVPVMRWIWAGWLADIGALDHAGGIALQTSAGVAALAVALLLRGRGVPDTALDPRLHIAGCAMVAVGWLALIGGSALGAGDAAATALVNALAAMAAAVLAALAIDRLRTGGVSVYSVGSAMIAGLAGISAGAPFVGLLGAIMLGGVAALVAAAASGLIGRMPGLAASAFAIHGAPAMAGAVLFPLAMPAAVGGTDFIEGTTLLTQLAAQGVAVVAVALWSAVATVIAALMISVVVPMKAPVGREG
jgi:ammonium transporter, Amt family